MKRSTLILLLAAQSGFASAQSASAPPAAPASQPVVTEVVVQGERSKVETRVDRKVYAVSQDLQGTLGSAVDILRNIPSVSMDVDGNPTLRGDAGVTIFINGRFAPQFNTPNRGAALEQLAADGIDRVEVIPNPPANFKREGTAGVINIITRRKTESRSASARASVGSGGRYNGNTALAGSVGKLGLHGTSGIRHDLRIRDFTQQSIVRDADSGALLSGRDLQLDSEDDRLSKSIVLGADYEASAQDTVSAEVNYYRRDADTLVRESGSVTDPSGTLTGDYLRTRRSDEYEYETDVTLSYARKGERDGDGLKISYERSDGTERRPLRFAEQFVLPPQADLFHRQSVVESELTNELNAEHTRTFDSKAKWILGYNLERIESLFDVAQTVRAPAGQPPQIDVDFSNTFRNEQTIHALYGSFEQPFGKWTALLGLRLENVELDLNQVTTNQRSGQSYFYAYPSLHLSHELNERQTLTFSYSRRVSRPNWQSLNPYPLKFDEFTVQTGNPDLRPTKFDSLEAGWSYERGRTALSATVYAKHYTDGVDYVAIPVSATSVIVRPENGGDGVEGGLELVASGRFSTNIDWSLSTDAYYNEIEAGDSSPGERNSAVSYAGKAALNMKPGAKSRVQLNLTSSGKRPTSRGYNQGSTVLDVGYRYQLRPNFSLVGTVSDLFESRRFRFVYDSGEVTGSTDIQQPGRIFFVGVSWTLAGKGDRPEKFEYER